MLPLYQEGSLKLTFQKAGLPLKRPLEGEEGPLAQQQYLARLQELQSASDTSLRDFTKPPSATYPQGSRTNLTLFSSLNLFLLLLKKVFKKSRCKTI